MPREFSIPRRGGSGPTEYASREPEFARLSIVETDEGEELVIVNWLKEDGLYVVSRKDSRGPSFASALAVCEGGSDGS